MCIRYISIQVFQILQYIPLSIYLLVAHLHLHLQNLEIPEMSADIINSASSHYGGCSNESFYHYNTPNNNVMSYNSGYHSPVYTSGLPEDKHAPSLSNLITNGISSADCTYWSEDMQSPDNVISRYPPVRSMSLSSEGYEEEEDQDRYCQSTNDYKKYYYQDNAGTVSSYHDSRYNGEPTGLTDRSYVNLENVASKTVRNVSKAANKKERRRTQSINNAFSDLRECIPNVPSDTKLSKIKTLRLATSYISYLMKVLETDDIISIDDFKADLSSHSHRKSQKNQYENSNNSNSGDQSSQYVLDNSSCSQYSSQANQPVRSQSSCNNNNNNNVLEECHLDGKKSKGRTGWPQHVWALELKQEQL
uniref:Heart- and neural crest derivatives-expressed protein 2 n=1 Tax=Cacopsylla melanoneura TaxID=428564 RepID=A0A8D8LPQ2_9HEMI